MKKYFAIIFITILLFSCRKEKPIDGPSLTNLFGAFSILTGLEMSTDVVDFAAGETVYFTAELSKTSSWRLRITGLTSGAEKIVDGLSQSINVEEYVWDGSTTELPLFKSELCQIELSFPNESDTTFLDTIEVITPKINEGFIVADFENGFNSGWSTFIQTGAFMDFQIKNDATLSAEGNSYYNMQGEVSWDWLIGLVYFNANAYGTPTYPLNANANNVYFNAMIYGEAGFPNSIVLFQFDEDDNEDGIFDEATEDRYVYEIPVTWSGWQLVSLSYSDIAALVAASGNQVPEPNKLRDINMLHLANPVSGLAKSKLDYIIFTENGALNP